MDRRSKEAERRKRILDHAKTNGNVRKHAVTLGLRGPASIAGARNIKSTATLD